eukprot:2934060-Pyramimonas_sp.AAC.2
MQFSHRTSSPKRARLDFETVGLDFEMWLSPRTYSPKQARLDFETRGLDFERAVPPETGAKNASTEH